MRFISDVDITNNSDFNLEIGVICEFHGRVLRNPYKMRALPQRTLCSEMRRYFLIGQSKTYSLKKLEYIVIELFYEKQSVYQGVFVHGGSWSITNASLDMSIATIESVVDVIHLDRNVKPTYILHSFTTAVLCYSACTLYLWYFS
jgi:hypothetical protein